MEKMAEVVSGSAYQRLHHMLSESAWDRRNVRWQLITDANTCFGYPSALVIDESAFAKKGDKSAGVARQWNGRLGKTDNSQVGVFAAVARDGVAAVVDGELYVPEDWFADPVRCLEAGMPEGLEFRTKGEVVADYLKQRVWLWDGVERRARCWHLLVRREIDGSKLKFCLANAKPEASLRHLAQMQATRHFVERAFEDAKGACGMADYQVRGFHAWHHHMALVMVALMFLAKERLALRETAALLSCNDLVEIMHHKLPTKIETDDDLVTLIENRHRRRRSAMDHAYRKQAAMLEASMCGGI
jgi:SRSO17 transposase